MQSITGGRAARIHRGLRVEELEPRIAPAIVTLGFEDWGSYTQLPANYSYGGFQWTGWWASPDFGAGGSGGLYTSYPTTNAYSRTGNGSEFDLYDLDMDAWTSGAAPSNSPDLSVEIFGYRDSVQVYSTTVDLTGFVNQVSGGPFKSVSLNWTNIDEVRFYSNVNRLQIDIDNYRFTGRPFVSDVPKSGVEDTVLNFASGDFTSKFSDIDGDSMNRIRVTSLPGNGTLRLSGTPVAVNDEIVTASLGNLTFTPNPDWSGSTSFGWRASDGTFLSNNTAQVNISMANTNDPPTAVNDAAGVNEDATTANLHATLLSNDTDPDPADSKNIVSVNTAGTVGAVSFNDGADTLTYTATGLDSLAQGATTTDTFTYTMEDGSGVQSTATVTMTITGVNDAPALDLDTDNSSGSGGADFQSTFTGGLGPVAISDTDTGITDIDSANVASATITLTNRPDGDAVESLSMDAAAAAVATAAGITTQTYNSPTGVFTLSGNATLADYEAAIEGLRYDNTNPFSSADRIITVLVNDGFDNSNTAATTMTVIPSIPPTVTAGGTLGYTEGQAGQVIDNGVTVSDPDDTDMEGATVSVTGGFFAGDTLGFTDQLGIAGSYDGGTGVLTLIGTSSVANYQTALCTITYSSSSDNPTAFGPNTSRTIRYVVNDGITDSLPATATVSITAVNDAPALSDAGGTLAYAEGDGAVVIDNALTVADVDDTDVDHATVQITGNYQNGEDVLAFADTATITGSWDAATGTLTLTGPDTLANYEAALESITYGNASEDPNTASRTVSWTVNDGDTDSNTATSTIAVTAANDAPGNAVPVAQSVNEDTDLVFSSGNGNQIQVSDVDVQSGDLEVTLSVNDGVLTLAQTTGLAITTGDGTQDANMVFTGTPADINAALNGLIYRGNQDYNGADTLTITTDDQGNTGSGGAMSDSDTVGITVDPVNDAPTANDDPDATDEDTVLNVAASGVLINDTDPDASDTLTVSAVNGNGTDVGVPVTLASGALLTLNADGSYTYDPNGQFEFLAVGESTTDTFGYTVSDGNGGTDTATVTITINGVNDAPTANNDGYTTNEDTVVNVGAPGVLSNDTDPDTSDTLTVSAVNGNGADVGNQITLPSGALLTLNADGSTTYNPNGQFEYLAVGETTTDTFTYQISDGNGGFDTATVTVTINGANDATTANADTGTTDEDSVLNVAASGVLTNDTDIDTSDTLAVSAVNGNAADVGIQVTLASGALLTLNADGSYAYDPNGQFEYLAVGESTTDTLDYTASDGNGSTDTATVTITITGVNDAPTANADGYVTNEDTSFTTGNVLSNDTDPDTSDTLAVSGMDTTGTIGSVTNNGNGTFDYNPNGQFEYLAVGELTTDTFTYQISDGSGGFDTATVTVTINGLNDPVTANVDTGTTDEDTVLNVAASGVLTNDTDPDANDILTVSAVNGNGADVGVQVTLASGALLTLNADGSYAYDPNGQFDYLAVGDSTTDTFDYTASDGNGSTDTATVTLTITGVNDAPSIGGLAGDSLTYYAGFGPTVVDQGTAATVSDPDAVDFDTGALTVTIAAGGDAAEDLLAIDDSGTVSLSAGMSNGSVVSVGGTAVGTITSDGAGGNDLVITFDQAAGNATPARVEALVQSITFENTDIADPTTGARTVRFTMADGDGGTSANYDTTVDVNSMPRVELASGQVILYDTIPADLDVDASDVRVKLDATGSVIKVIIVGNPTGLGMLVKPIGDNAVTIRDARCPGGVGPLEDLSFVACMNDTKSMVFKTGVTGYNAGPILLSEGVVASDDLDADGITGEATAIYCAGTLRLARVAGDVDGDVASAGIDSHGVGAYQVIIGGLLAGEVSAQGDIRTVVLLGGTDGGAVRVGGNMTQLISRRDFANATVDIDGDLRRAVFRGGMDNSAVTVDGTTTVFSASAGQTNSTLNLGGDVTTLLLRGGMTGTAVVAGGDVRTFAALGPIQGASTVHVAGATTAFKVTQGITGGSTVDLDGNVSVACIFGASGQASIAAGCTVTLGRDLTEALVALGEMAGVIDIVRSARDAAIRVAGSLTGDLLSCVFGDVTITGAFSGNIGDAGTTRGMDNMLRVTVPGATGTVAPANAFARYIGFP